MSYLVFYMGEKQDEDWCSYDSFIYHTENPITSQKDLDRLKSVIKKKKTKWKNIVVRDLILLKRGSEEDD